MYQTSLLWQINYIIWDNFVNAGFFWTDQCLHWTLLFGTGQMIRSFCYLFSKWVFCCFYSAQEHIHGILNIESNKSSSQVDWTCDSSWGRETSQVNKFFCNPDRSQSIATRHGALFHKMNKVRSQTQTIFPKRQTPPPFWEPLIPKNMKYAIWNMKYEICNIYHVIVHFLPKKHCFWPKKALFFKFTKVSGFGKTPPHVGKNSQIISFFFVESVPNDFLHPNIANSWQRIKLKTNNYNLSVNMKVFSFSERNDNCWKR